MHALLCPVTILLSAKFRPKGELSETNKVQLALGEKDGERLPRRTTVSRHSSHPALWACCPEHNLGAYHNMKMQDLLFKID